MQAVSEKSELGEDSRAGKLWEGFLEEGFLYLNCLTDFSVSN